MKKVNYSEVQNNAQMVALATGADVEIIFALEHLLALEGLAPIGGNNSLPPSSLDVPTIGEQIEAEKSKVTELFEDWEWAEWLSHAFN